MSGVPATAPAATPQKLDELMLAMDVVDTLRHQDSIVARELAEADRAAGLKEHLREIYRGQGIEVPDRILEDGIKALKDSRFVYTPPAPSASVTLARLWVRRAAWGRRAMIAVAALVAGIGVYVVGVRWPAERAAEQARVELAETLPRQLQAAHQAVLAEARVDAARQRAATLLDGGRAAVARGDAATAREVVADLDRLTAQLRREYTLRIAGRADEQTGLVREPTNASGRRWFLVVNAVDGQNRAVELPIRNEETDRIETVSRFAVGVTRETYEAVRADKQRNGLVRADRLGEKRRGELDVTWLMGVAGGAITRW